MTPRAARRSFWPDETQQALLRVALGPPEEAARRWDELQPLDVTTLPRGSFALLPLLHERLATVAPDEAQLPRLRGTYRRTWYRNQLFLRRLGRLLPRLRRRGLDPLLVGGAAGHLRWYPSPGLRPVTQLEVVVPYGTGQDALAVAAAMGWRRVSRSGVASRLVDDRKLPLVVYDGAPPVVAGPLGRDGGYRSLRERALELSRPDGSPLVLDPADELLFLCAVGARTAFPPTCQWLVDVHRLLRSGELPPVNDVIVRAHQLRLVEPLRETVACLADVFGVDGLAELLAALHAQPPSRRDRMAFRLGSLGSSRLAGPAQLLSTHLHTTAGASLPRTVARLPRHLQEHWGTPRVGDVPVVALRKVARIASPQRPQPADPARRRSASS